jgi:hypothetical protein
MLWRLRSIRRLALVVSRSAMNVELDIVAVSTGINFRRG